ncbi:MAG TPA: XRE family transcriptional regulator [Pyrinomonadaceae bacterium]|jgi:transcriptional regulator with XRE-family HTH domain/Zn-dependent peptidase ImmA (M78 family)
MQKPIKSFGEMFKEERVKKGVILREIGKVVNKSVAYLSDVEHGRRGAPDLETVAKIEKILRITDGRFVTAAARERAGLPSQLIKKVTRRQPVANLLLRADHIPDAVIRKAATPRSGAAIDADAEHIIEIFQSDMLTKPEPFKVEHFFECQFYQYFKVWSDYRDLQPNVHGYLNIEELHVVINAQLAENQNDTVQRRFLRSTIAHELGHYFLHEPEFRVRMQLEEFADSDDASQNKHIPVYADPEWQAWRFAGALLMPKPSLEAALKLGCNTTEELCDVFAVNPAFMNSRLRALKMSL